MVIDNEVWIHYYNPESKFESMERKHAGSSKRKMFKITLTTTKLMAIVFWDSESVMNGVYLHKGKGPVTQRFTA